jgi:hypothetical protein
MEATIFNEIRNIKTPKGEVLEVQMTGAFATAVRKHFNLSPDQRVEDDHVRMFVWGALNAALEKEEKKVDEGERIAG